MTADNPQFLGEDPEAGQERPEEGQLYPIHDKTFKPYTTQGGVGPIIRTNLDEWMAEVLSNKGPGDIIASPATGLGQDTPSGSADNLGKLGAESPFSLDSYLELRRSGLDTEFIAPRRKPDKIIFRKHPTDAENGGIPPAERLLLNFYPPVDDPAAARGGIGSGDVAEPKIVRSLPEGREDLSPRAALDRLFRGAGGTTAEFRRPDPWRVRIEQPSTPLEEILPKSFKSELGHAGQGPLSIPKEAPGKKGPGSSDGPGTQGKPTT